MSTAGTAKTKANDVRQTRKSAAIALAQSKVVTVCMPMFHGTADPFEVFDPAKCKSEIGLWLSAHRRLAELYARSRDGIVLEFAVDLKRVAEYSIAHHNPWLDPPEWRKFFLEAGFDGLRIENDSDTYVIALEGQNVLFTKQYEPQKP